MSGFDIGGRHIGDDAPCFLIAEVGLAHEGSLATAHAYIDACADAGVDAVKFQCHLGDTVKEWRVEPTWPQDASRQEYWERTGFTEEQWWSLAAHCAEAGVEFLCSPFSVEAVRLLDPMVKAWKVPSGKVEDSRLLQAMVNTGKPLIASFGMSPNAEISDIVGGFCPDALLQSTSMYPCPPEKVGLGVMNDLAKLTRVDTAVGLSDHSGTIYAGLAAVALGAKILEVHVCFSKRQFGSDVLASITIEQLRQLEEGVRFTEKALTPVDKDKLAEELSDTRRLYMGVA